jgi:hypothetical protein
MLIKGVTDWLRPAESTKQRFDYLKLWAVWHKHIVKQKYVTSRNNGTLWEVDC